MADHTAAAAAAPAAAPASRPWFGGEHPVDGLACGEETPTEFDRHKLSIATTIDEVIAAVSVTFDTQQRPALWKLWAALANDYCAGFHTLSAELAWALADHWLGSSASGAVIFSCALLQLEPSRRAAVMACAGLERRRMLARTASDEDPFAILIAED